MADIELTDRDIAALAELGELGLMDTEMLFARHYSRAQDGRDVGNKYCQRRLSSFAKAKYVESISPTITARAVGGTCRPQKQPSVHRLTQLGADEVERRTGIRPRRPGLSKPPKPVTLLHRLGIVRTRLAIDDGYRHLNMPIPQWIHEQDMDTKVPSTAPQIRQRILYESFGRGLYCYPDASALLHIPGNPPGNLAVYLEYDRATEGRRQIEEKLAGYGRLLDPVNYRYRRHWPQVEIAFVRVVFVCPSAERRTNLIAWTRELAAAPYFRFATEQDLAPERILTEQVWLDALAQARRIIRLPPS